MLVPGNENRCFEAGCRVVPMMLLPTIVPKWNCHRYCEVNYGESEICISVYF